MATHTEKDKKRNKKKRKKSAKKIDDTYKGKK